MKAGARLKPRSMVGRLVLMTAGLLLMIAPPFIFSLLKLPPQFQSAIVAGIELVALVAGFVLLYFGIREQKSPSSKS